MPLYAGNLSKAQCTLFTSNVVDVSDKKCRTSAGERYFIVDRVKREKERERGSIANKGNLSQVGYALRVRTYFYERHCKRNRKMSLLEYIREKYCSKNYVKVTLLSSSLARLGL